MGYLSPFLLTITLISLSITTPPPLVAPSYPWINRPQQCSGGYAHCVEIDFSKYPQNETIYGWAPGFTDMFLLNVTVGGEDGTYSCAKPDEGTTRCLYSPYNVRIVNSALELIVPGPTKPNVTIGAAQVIFLDPTVFNSTFILSGYFEVEAQTSPVPGTCHGIFTQANPGYPIQKDEQDIEILTGHYTHSGHSIPAGLEFTSWAAHPANDSMPAREVNFVVPYGYDPTSTFFPYSIEWNAKKTTYTWGTKSKEVDIYSSTSPSKLCINNWSNGGAGWTEGPPLKDNILRIRMIKAYYNTKA